ncbi:hypothetical protein [Segniliparus rugosus]|uniref:Uncharacterized protein n=1 Tax=Segniliparus rugosus (strain ATCC BAA-974 / DSM 45345 / CCUG 50838 / CIP 108380 / JCM 13579 / CDC 945) TaxID=679197 RepID=E5XTJ2_SEGRC|nr:hypothetical protein [Segniliparus rugosus]EFV12331.1 hypothetical protein HMPREF9336_02814 [Segniliparus rugosus ATCC BAA-974]
MSREFSVGWRGFSDERKDQLNRRLVWGRVVAPIAGGIAALGTWYLLGSVWRDCEFRMNGGYGFLLLFLVAAVFVMAGVLAWFVHALVCLVPARSAPALAVVAAVCAAGALMWSVVSAEHNPDGTGVTRCESGVPPWWPSWIPL